MAAFDALVAISFFALYPGKCSPPREKLSKIP
jgi:hypothetical protein